MSDETRFGRFRLVERRAVGGMGEVWHAVIDGPRGFEQSVILKRIRPEHAADPQFVAMLGAEARVCARLDHPAIVRVFEFGEVAGEYYLAMELVDGWNLTDVLAGFRRAGRVVPVPFVCHVGAEIADALAYAHALADDDGHPFGLVHRDVSPGNLMITRQGAVKLVDFGVHTIRDRRADEQTAVGVLRGTLAYMSPEQADGRPVDHRSDVFSLGVVLYEALTGVRLFRAPGDLETLRRVRDASVAAPSSSRPDLDPRLDRLLLAMLARSPDARPSTCAEVARELRNHRAGLDAARVRELLADLELPGIAAAPGPMRPTTQPLVPDATRGRRTWLWAALITLACSLPYAMPSRCGARHADDAPAIKDAAPPR